MLQRLGLAIWLVMLSGCGARQDSEVQGTWRVVTLEAPNPTKAKKDKAQIAKMVVTFKGDKFALARDDPGKEAKTIKSGKFRVDPTKVPRELDLMETGNPPRQGIYKIEGGQLTITLAGENEDRPTDFAGKKEDLRTFLILQRESQ